MLCDVLLGLEHSPSQSLHAGSTTSSWDMGETEKTFLFPAGTARTRFGAKDAEVHVFPLLSFLYNFIVFYVVK